MFSIKHLGSERKCQKMLDQIILGKELNCPYCGNPIIESISKDYYWCKHCRKKIRSRSLTWLRSSKISAKDLIILIWSWQKKTSPGSIKTLYGISYTTTSRWYKKFRIHLPRDKNVLQGVVETDEAFFGRRKYDNQTIVIGSIERRQNKLRLKIIPDREQETLEQYLFDHVHKESLLHTDCWMGYYDIFWKGIDHEHHNHSLGHFKNTNRIENVWSVTKRQIRMMYGQIRTEKLPEFIQEWEARWNFPELFKNPFTYLENVLFRIS